MDAPILTPAHATPGPKQRAAFGQEHEVRRSTLQDRIDLAGIQALLERRGDDPFIQALVAGRVDHTVEQSHMPPISAVGRPARMPSRFWMHPCEPAPVTLER